MMTKEVKAMHPGKRIMASVFYDPERVDITEEADFDEKQCFNVEEREDAVLVNVDYCWSWFEKHCVR